MIPAIGSLVFYLIVVVCLYVIMRAADTIAAQERDPKPNRFVQLLAVVVILGALLGGLIAYTEWTDMKRIAENTSSDYLR